ncbi:N-acetyl-gamma-glutamyl-phosphate reductase [Psychroflexus sp. CAK8W]|uniref:N-acetyl-gamma-glutamyl-phosphate reductase n=1 Tax=Psychroflexus longus TaxID=2873596 RepID=A0ABS7XI38_9FLAO|nr:N-acetyl-gamma-glutamyl-phosphate reductase [Psychroflexus longus]MBZ9778390.1 N-acetyl-gamma-glutamyl-phosphate reductase [Psychroflexus longus]
MIQVGIIGGAGYTAGELIRLLLNHPQAHLDFIFSTSNAGNFVHQVHQDLVGTTDLKFSSEINSEIDVVFLCLGHGNSKAFLEKNKFSDQTKIIDLSNDFRLKTSAKFQGKTFVYGLPEVNKTAIKSANFIANPGCFASAIQLALLPLAKAHLLQKDVHVNAVTGATGAGTSPSATTHFAWRDNNFSSYKVFSHQHLDEISEILIALQSQFNHDINFIPNRGNFSRGIFASCYTHFEGTLQEAKMIYEKFYDDACFTIVLDQEIHLKQVVNTNNCLLHLQKHKDKLLITSVLDNLLKGASGQAIQNMNLMFGLDEAMGLKLKANYF